MSETQQAIKQTQMELFALNVQRKGLSRTLRKLRAQRRREVNAQYRGQLKKCLKCNIKMHRDCFYGDDRSVDGKYPYCRVCKSNMVIAARKKKAA